MREGLKTWIVNLFQTTQKKQSSAQESAFLFQSIFTAIIRPTGSNCFSIDWSFFFIAAHTQARTL